MFRKLVGFMSKLFCKLGFHSYRVHVIDAFDLSSARFKCERCGKEKTKPIW